MSLKVYNTLKKRKEIFQPADKKNVRMYVCGVTVYDECHLGHARAYVSFDVIRRYLEYKGYKVKHVQNFTDIDDKVIAKARSYRKELLDRDGKQVALSEAVKIIAQKYTEEYFTYMDKLLVRRADIYPKATESIPEMIKIVEALIEKGYAYAVDGDIFFSIDKFSQYGKLSHRKLDDMKAGARVEVDERKRHPLDFALWKKAKEDEPSWESPWGNGRPGWHIECSAMSMKYLSDSLDIHGGGQDLIFPHHENEIAQSEAYTGKPFSRYWLHNGFVTIDRQKMSKSLGNFFTLREIFEKYEPEVIRLFLISTHYRHPIDFSNQELEKAKRRYERLKECDQKIRNEKLKVSCKLEEKGSQFRRRFEKYMDDDFNTAGAIGVIFDMVKYLNTRIAEGKTGKGNFAKVVNEFARFREFLGLPVTEEVEPFEVGWDEIDDSPSISDDEIEELLQPTRELTESDIKVLTIEKELARKNKNWEKADRIRVKISKYRRVKDTTSGTSVFPLK